MADDLVKRLRRNITNGWPDDVDLQACNEAADRIEKLEKAYAQQQQVWSDAIKRRDVLESLFPAILEYLEKQADVVDGDNGIPAPNIAMSLLVWTKHALEGNNGGQDRQSD